MAAARLRRRAPA